MKSCPKRIRPLSEKQPKPRGSHVERDAVGDVVLNSGAVDDLGGAGGGNAGLENDDGGGEGDASKAGP